MRVRYTDTALAEIQEISSHIEADSPRAAEAVVAQIEHTVKLIGDLPEIGTLKYRGIVRMQTVRRYRQYLVFYAIKATRLSSSTSATERAGGRGKRVIRVSSVGGKGAN